MKIKWPYLKLRHKIIASIYAVLLPAFLLTMGVLYFRAADKKQARQASYNRVVATLDESLGYMEQDMIDIATYLSINDAIHNVLVSDTREFEEDPFFWKNQTSIGVIKDILAVKTKIVNLALYPENGRRPFFVNRDRSVLVQDIQALRSLEIYRRAVEANGAALWQRLDAGKSGVFLVNTEDKIVMFRELYDLSKRARLGFLMMAFDVAGYARICENALVGERDGIVILDADGRTALVFGNVHERVVSALNAVDGLPKDGAPALRAGMYVFGRRRSLTGQMLYYVTPVRDAAAVALAESVVPMLLGLGLLLSVWVLSLLASRLITRPLSDLNASMNEFRSGDYHQQVTVVGNDEISALTETFNAMVGDVRNQIQKNYEMAGREKESEFDALQTSINPHFLYNALDCLYWEAVESGSDRVAEDILSLAELFRVLLSSGKREIEISQEMEIVRNYMQVQKLRFGNKFDYAIRVDEAARHLTIPKLIIQPFVENAVVHGMEKSDCAIFVDIQCVLEGAFVCFTIQDDGVGMSQERLEDVTRSSNDDAYASQRIGHFAIHNVRERMLLRYGAQATLTIESALMQGTRVEIRIPI